jgi:hypothetical protein
VLVQTGFWPHEVSFTMRDLSTVLAVMQEGNG